MLLADMSPALAGYLFPCAAEQSSLAAVVAVVAAVVVAVVAVVVAAAVAAAVAVVAGNMTQ